MAITVWSDVQLNDIGRKLLEILEFYPGKADIYITSSVRSEPGSYHSGNLQYGGSMAVAIDIGFGGTGQPEKGRDVALWLIQFSKYIVEEIHTTPFDTDNGFYVKNQRVADVYDAATKAQHANHVHLATSATLADQWLASIRVQTTPPPSSVPVPAPAPVAISDNPNPNYVTDAMWWFWRQFDVNVEPRTLLGGIYANKPGYHNTRSQNSSGDYSVQHADDRTGPDRASAIDLTFPDAQAGDYTTIKRYANRLLAAGQANDPRSGYMKEFFGQTDDDNGVEGWDFRAHRTTTSDTSHLWHIHISFNRKDCGSYLAMDATLSIMRGETLAAFQARQGVILPPPPPPPTPPPTVGLKLKGLDYSWGRPTPLSGLQPLGITFVSRYLAPLPNGKVILAAERDQLLAAGVNIMLNWENTAGDQSRGAAGGTSDATEAVKQARALGYPSGSTIYFSADFDVSVSAWNGQVKPYQIAARAVTNAAGYRFGVYGGYRVISLGFDQGVIQDGWQAYAWSLKSQVGTGPNAETVNLRGSDFTFDKRASVRQVENNVTVLGAACDNDVTTGGPLYFWNHTTTGDDEDMPLPANFETHFNALIFRVEALINDRPVVTGGPTKGEMNKSFRKALIRGSGKTAVYLADGDDKFRRWVAEPARVAELTRIYGQVYEVPDATLFGPIVGDNPGDV